MKRSEPLKHEREGLSDIQSMVEVYQEIAAERMTDVRREILAGREFFDGLLDLYRDVKPSWHENVTLAGRSGAVAIFLSANNGLFGTLVDRVADEFIRFVRSSHAHAVVVGSLGKRILQGKAADVIGEYIEFSDDTMRLDQLSHLMQKVLRYEKIFVFHGKYTSLIVQDAKVSSVTGDSIEGIVGKAKKMHARYLLEPSIADVIRIFENEITTSLIERAIHESRLAKYAARMMYLDGSLARIAKRQAMLAQEERKLNRAYTNRRQQAVLSGIHLWKR